MRNFIVEMYFDAFSVWEEIETEKTETLSLDEAYEMALTMQRDEPNVKFRIMKVEKTKLFDLE